MSVGANCHSDMVMELMVMMCMQYSVSVGECKAIASERQGDYTILGRSPPTG